MSLPVYKIYVPRISDGKIVHVDKYIVCGGVTHACRAAIENRGLTPKSKALLHDYYGSHWASILDIQTTKIKGGSEDVDFVDDIDALLRQQDVDDTPIDISTRSTRTGYRATSDNGPKYIFDYGIYPFDKPFDVREKIYMIADIPVYRQHLYWKNGTQITVPYSITFDDIEVDIDIEQTLSESDQKIMGLPIDRELYSRRAEYNIDDVENFITIGNNNVLYVIDLDDIIDHTTLHSLSDDSYRFDLVYHGFIAKFWPLMTPDIFKVYVTEQNDISAKFPDLARPKRVLYNILSKEKEIIEDTLKLKERSAILVEKKILDVAITRVLATTSSGTKVDIRNMFDRLIVDKRWPMARAYVEEIGKTLFTQTSTYQMDKRLPGKPAPTHNYFKKELNSTDILTITVVVAEYHNYLFVNISPGGVVSILGTWLPENKISHNELQRLFNTYITPLINILNSFGRGVFIQGGQLLAPTPNNIVINNLNISVFWKKQMGEAGFKKIKSAWQGYNAANIIYQRGSQIGNSYDFLFTKGVVGYDSGIIDKQFIVTTNEIINSHYYRFSSIIFKTRWALLYSGRKCSLVHRTADVRFDIKDIKDDEFDLFMMFLGRFAIRNNETLDNVAKDLPRDNVPGDKKLRKLREVDPELYNMRKHGSVNDYSILCQRPRQPVIFSDDEISRLKSTAGLFKYKNFTTNKPIYYSCPSKDYPHLSFITGEHPLGYCLPCCGKTSAGPGSKKERVIKGCLSDHKFEDTTERTYYHLTNYTHIEPGRASKLPLGPIRSIFVDELPDVRYVVKGIDPSTGLLGAVFDVTNLTPYDLTDLFESIPDLYTGVCFGAIAAAFPSAKAFSNHYRRILNGEELLIMDQEVYDTFAIEMLSIKGYMCVVIEDKKHTDSPTQTLECIETNSIKINAFMSKFEYIVLIRSNTTYNVIVEIGPDYSRSNKILNNTFKNDSVIGQRLTKIITGRQGGGGLAEYMKTYGGSVVAGYTNLRNLIYGIVVSVEPGKGVWIPVDESPIIPLAKIVNGVFDPMEMPHGLKYPFESLYKLIKKPWTKIVGQPPIALVADYMYYFDHREGDIVDDIKVVELGYNPIEVNKAIYKRSPPGDGKDDLVSEGLYTNYIYDLLIMEFSNRVSKERDVVKRGELVELFKKINKNSKYEVDAFIQKHNCIEDAKTITAWYNIFSKTGDRRRLILSASSYVYKFDNKTVTAVKNAIKSEALSIIEKYIAEWTVRMSPNKNGKMPNIIVPCEEGPSMVCAEGKLIIPVDNRYIEYLYEDILADRIYNKDRVIDFFSFEPRPDQIINVTKFATDHSR